jgi:hypothetical protein
MAQIAYIVTATLPNRATAEEYLAWLREGHVADVIAHGALSGEIVLLDAAAGTAEAGGQPEGERRVEVRYRFGDRAAFDRYEREGALALRADGLARFGPDRRVRFERRVGEVVASIP